VKVAIPKNLVVKAVLALNNKIFHALHDSEPQLPARGQGEVDADHFPPINSTPSHRKNLVALGWSRL
jgi:hypothetical protein